MSEATGDWRRGLDDVDAALIDGLQSGFPVAERPFEVVGAELGIAADEALDRVRRLSDEGIFRRFGPVLNPPVIGSSTLAAVRAPEERFDEVAAVINDVPQVNHNYARDHEWNMWFVVTAASKERRDAILDEIETETGCAVLVLPMLTDFYIDLEFPVVNADRFAREGGETGAAVEGGETGAEGDGGETGAAVEGGETSEGSAVDETGEAGGGETVGDGEAAGSDGVPDGDGRRRVAETAVEPTRISERAAVDLDDLERRLLLAVQDGFPLSATPYRDVASAVDAPVADVLAAVERLLADGCIKRIGCVVNHLATGFDANCMVVWDVPDAELDDRGVAVGELPYVTLCYHRPRRPERGWEYNLFTMIHGREQAAVDAKIDELAAEHLPVPHERLYSTATLKQTGARYDALVGKASGEAATEGDVDGAGGADDVERPPGADDARTGPDAS